jgi:protein ImuB
MKRVLAIWLPNWPVQRLVLSRPELAGRAVVLHGAGGRGQCVTACSAEAQRVGVEAGIPVAEAIAILSTLHPSDSLPSAGREPESFERKQGGEQRGILEPHDPTADRAGLVELAQWCHRFSPSVGLEEGDAPETLLLDATNLAPLYGGEAELVAQVAHAMRRRGLEARLAIADTVGAAWGLVRFDDFSPGLCPGVALHGTPHLLDDPRAEPGAEGELGALPLAALRLPGEMIATLAELGIACVGDVLQLAREQLRSRFGPLLLLRIDQLLGATPEVFAAIDPSEEFAVKQALESPISRTDAIQFTIAQLLDRLAWLLTTRNAGALAVACRFECEGAPAVTVEFGLFQPTASARHLLELAEWQLERVRLPAPVAGIEVRVVRHAPLEQRQGVLFDQERTLESSRPLAALVDRLAGRLGRETVVRCRLRSDSQPELAYREEPLVGSTGGASKRTRASGGRQPSAAGRISAARRRKKTKEAQAKEAEGLRPPLDGGKNVSVKGALDRPLCLLARPAALVMTMSIASDKPSVVPDKPPTVFRLGREQYQVARHWGPERIETGWWRRERTVRDYYRVETTEGRRFWLFRRLRDGQWFLHAGYE